MDPCKEFEELVKIELEAYEEAKKDAFLRFILGFLGFESLYDYLKTGNIDWTAIFDAIVVLDLAYIITQFVRALRSAGLSGAAKQLAKKLGPWAIGILIIDLGYQLYNLYNRWSEASDEFNERINELYNRSECDQKDNILRELSVERED